MVFSGISKSFLTHQFEIKVQPRRKQGQMPIRRGIKALSLLHCHTLFLKSSSQWEGSNFGPSICGGHSEALCIFVWSWHHQSADESAQSISLDLANSSKLSHSLHDFPSYLLYTYLLLYNMFMFQLGSNIFPNLSLSTKSLSAPFDTLVGPHKSEFSQFLIFFLQS